MDGVNKHYYYDHRFEEMVENRRIYKAGYSDGMRDRALLVRLRGRRWLRNHCFTYEDYYDPYASVRIWLENMTLAFAKAPARRLPPGWRHKIHPRAKKYRKWMRKRQRRYSKRMRKRHRRNRRWHRREYDDDYYEERSEEYEEREEEFDD